MKTFNAESDFSSLPDNVSTYERDRVAPSDGNLGVSTMWLQNAKPGDGHFSRIANRAGAPAGLGFWCPDCSLEIRHSAPRRVFHCGHWEDAPENVRGFPEHHL
jgi:hypothetical protein